MVVDTVDIKNVPSVKEVQFKDAKCSDWVEQQPVERFCNFRVRNEHGQMCGLGIIADFYGNSWQRAEDDSLCDIKNQDTALTIVMNMTGSIFPYWNFDPMFSALGAKSAKEYTVEWLRKRGL